MKRCLLVCGLLALFMVPMHLQPASAGNCVAGTTTCSFNIPGTCSGPGQGRCDGDVCTDDFSACFGGVESNILDAGTFDAPVVGPVLRRVRAHIFFQSAPAGGGQVTVAWSCDVEPAGNVTSVTINSCSVQPQVSGAPVNDSCADDCDGALVQDVGSVAQGRIKGCVEATVTWESGSTTSTETGLTCNQFEGALPL